MLYNKIVHGIFFPGRRRPRERVDWSSSVSPGPRRAHWHHRHLCLTTA